MFVVGNLMKCELKQLKNMFSTTYYIKKNSLKDLKKKKKQSGILRIYFLESCDENLYQAVDIDKEIRSSLMLLFLDLNNLC